jgi:beta-N-acetylglucosaminidase
MVSQILKRSLRITSAILVSYVLIFIAFMAIPSKEYVVDDSLIERTDALLARAEASSQNLESSIYFIDNIELFVTRLNNSPNKIFRNDSKPDFNDVANLDLRSPSNVTAYELEAYFKKAGYRALQGHAEAFIKAEKEHQINALFMVALSIQESGGGKSNFAQERNNLFGYGAYTSNPGNAHSFSSVDDAIMTVAGKISKDYLRPAGRYHRGFTLPDVHKLYCTTGGWSSAIATIMLGINESIVRMEIEERKVLE